MAPSLVVWEIWKERNRRIFQEKEESSASLLSRVERAITESVSATARNHNLAKHPYTSEDISIQANWPLVNCQPVNGSWRVNPLSELAKEEVKWEPPTKEWIKINFDGASRGNPGISGVGVVARNDKGVILFKGARRLQNGTNNEAEAQVALMATKLAINMKVPKLHLEGDSQVVINAIAKGNTPSWKLSHWVEIIQEKLTSFEDFWVSHVRRGANAVADLLSNIGCDMTCQVAKWWKGNGRVSKWN